MIPLIIVFTCVGFVLGLAFSFVASNAPDAIREWVALIDDWKNGRL